MKGLEIRAISADDDAAIASIIRSVMPEFGAGGPGFAIHDPEVAQMSAAYSQLRHAYYVVLNDGVVSGGAGIAPLDGAEPEVCELRKMYFLPQVRGVGAGFAMMVRCLDTARALGFKQCYLETLCGMDSAQRLYERAGFLQIPAAMGNTGHFGCDRYYMRDL